MTLKKLMPVPDPTDPDTDLVDYIDLALASAEEIDDHKAARAALEETLAKVRDCLSQRKSE